jgi:hypothetical protein
MLLYHYFLIVGVAGYLAAELVHYCHPSEIQAVNVFPNTSTPQQF